MNLSCYAGLDASLGVCLGGACNATTGSCMCPDGWSGHTDMVPMDLSSWGGDVLTCAVHTLTVQILWCLPLVPALLSAIVAVPSIREQLRIQQRSRKQYRRPWWQHPYCLAFIFLMEILTCVGLVAIKLTAQHHLIGVHAAPTILFVRFLQSRPPTNAQLLFCWVPPCTRAAPPIYILVAASPMVHPKPRFAFS